MEEGQGRLRSSLRAQERDEPRILTASAGEKGPTHPNLCVVSLGGLPGGGGIWNLETFDKLR